MILLSQLVDGFARGCAEMRARRVRRAAVATAVTLFGMVGGGSAASAATTTTLLLPQSTAFSILGHSCGGIQEQAFATGFDPTSGYPTGSVYLQTKCGGSGRGGGYHTTTYSAWVGATWDFTASVVSSAVLATAPTVDPTFSAFDGYGNEVYNASNSAFLALASGYVPVPRVTSLSVTTGPGAGGTSLTIIGTGFSGATAMSFGATAAASFVVDSDTSITALSPAAGVGTVDVTVTTPGGSNPPGIGDEFTFVAAPSVSGLSPDNGPVNGGTTVTITGAGLADISSVVFGETAVGFTVNDDGSITVDSPGAEAADTVHVRVTTTGGTSPISGADQFTYVTAGPTLSVSPPSGPVGSNITVSGGGFNPGEAVKVSFMTGLASHAGSVAVCKAKAADDGTFSCDGTVPAKAGGSGDHLVVAKGKSSATKVTTTFLLT